jgi:membrane-associated phospholipid phosphatase
MKGLKKIVLIIIFFAAQKSVAQNIDIDILKGINPRNPDAFVWKTASSSIDWVAGTITFGTLAYGFIQKDKSIQHNGYELLITSATNIAVTEIFKRVFNRTRPADKYPGEVFVNTPSNGKSFPSGHTSMAFAVATTLTLQYKKWYVTVPAYLWAGCVGYSRMYLGKHYPTDVLAGALVGAGCSYLGHIISNKLFRNKKSSRCHEKEFANYRTPGSMCAILICPGQYPIQGNTYW